MTIPSCKYGVICIDSGFTAGAAIVSLDEAEPKIIYADSCRTKKSNKKMKILVAEDDHRRATEGWRWLESLNEHVEVVIAVFTEAISGGGKSARAVRVMGYGASQVSAFANHLKVPLIQASAQAIKKAATKRRAASKQQVWDAMISKHPHLGLERMTKRDLEHAADACAIWEACKDAPEVQMMMRLRHG